MTREELFNNLKNGARWDVGVAINRSNSLPLDANSIFESYEAAKAYASKDASKIAPYGFLNNAYIGQIITVVPAEGDIGVYYIDADQKLQQIGKSIAADEASIVNKDGVITIYGFDAAGAKTYPRKTAEGKIEWITIEQLVEGATENTVTVGDNKTIDNTTTDTGYSLGLHGAATASENQVPALDADKKLKWINVYSKAEIDGKISGILSYKGTAAGAPTDNGTKILVGDNTITAAPENTGHVYFFGGKEYASDGTKWEELGSATDLSAYYTSAQVDAAIDADVKVEADRAIAAEKALGDRVVTLEKIDHSLYATKSEVTTLSEELTSADTELGKRITTIESTLNTSTTGLVAKVGALETLTGSHSGSIETLNEEVAKKLDKTVYEAYIDGKTYSDTQIDEKITDLGVDGVKTKVSTLEKLVGTAETDGLVKNMATTKGDITTIKSDITALKSADTGILTRLGDLESTDKSHTADIASLNTTVASHTTALAGLAGTVKEITNANATAAAEAKTIAQGAVTATQTNASNIATNATAIESVKGRVDTIESQIGGLTGAMHFKGAVSSDPTASDFDKTSYAAGDVVIFGNKEYVLTVVGDTKSFIELGDEGSYALKGDVYTKSDVDTKFEEFMSWHEMK